MYKMKEEIFKKIIEFLESNNIIYCVLGNTNDYPTVIKSDVDIVIDSSSFRKINSIVKRFSSEYQLEFCNLFQHEIEGKFFVAVTANNEKSNFTMLALDFCCNYMRQGRIILTEKELLNSRIRINQKGIEFWICSNEIAFTYYFIKKLEKQSINIDQFNYINNLWYVDRDKIIQQLFLRFQKETARELKDIFDKGDFNRLSKDFFKMLNKESQKRYNRGLVNHAFEFKRKIFRFTRPTGVVISVLGCDGSGKSTVIDLLINNSNDFEAFRETSYHHLFPSTNKPTRDKPVLNPHEQAPRSWIMSNLKLVYFLYKYLFGYWFIVYPQKVRSKLVIFDRYYYDILVDPIRYRHKGSPVLTNFIGRIIPKPDLLFIIDAPAEILQLRKQEVSFLESKRQREAYLNLKNKLSNVSIVDNTQQPEKSAFEVKKSIVNYLVNRFKKTY